VTDSRKGRVKGLFAGTSPDHELPEQAHGLPEPAAQHQALQVLVLAQRTADEHVAGAQHQADKVRAEARAMAERIVRDAQTHADGVRRDADKILNDARARAEETARDAQAKADGLDREAQQRYQDVVGSLAAKRAALQQQIEALQRFDRDYRAELRTFMQGQLRALGADEPPSNGDIRQPDSVATAGPLLAQE